MATIPTKEKEDAKHVKVVIRTRPTSEFAQNEIKFDADQKSVHIHIPKGQDGGFINNQQENWDFKFDNILHNASQEKLYDECGLPIVKSVMEGYHGTIMAYGQTGAGKTFTMTGATENYKHRGLIPRAISHIFREVAERPQMACTVRISYLEIYNEQIVDLLSPDSTSDSNESGALVVVEDNKTGVSHVKGLTMQIANNEEEALNLLFEGETNRSIAEHQLNKISTRSHCIFTIYLESRSRVESSERVISSKLNLVDLAGSERISKTHTQGLSLKEAMYINKSLTFLEQVIIALSDRKRDHIPYRQSKLTNVLRDSLGGSCNTLMIANIWGEKEHIEETISTLRFATRMMCVANTPRVNVQFDAMALIKKYEREVRELKQELAMHDSLANRSHVQYESFGEAQRTELGKVVKAYLKDEEQELEIVSLRQVREYFVQFKLAYKGLEQEREDLIMTLRKVGTSGSGGGASGSVAAALAGVGGLTKSHDDIRGSKMLPDIDDGVGETEASGFSVGLAPGNKEQLYRSNVKKKKMGMGGTSKPLGGMGGGVTPLYDDDDDFGYERDATSRQELHHSKRVNSGAKHHNAAYPGLQSISRADEFENFKRGKGSEMYRILCDNKASLKEKKKSAQQLAQQLNESQAQILSLKSQIESRRRTQKPGSTDNSGISNSNNNNNISDVIIDEEEYALIEKLKTVKASYRENMEVLKGLRGEIAYVTKLVESVRQKLMVEFESWFEACFGVGGVGGGGILEEGGRESGAGGYHGSFGEDLMDIGEKFDRLQLEKMSQEDPDSLPYYNARKNTKRLLKS
ncbi:P-loop containing nucleoside triphosphate hydrolase protein [Obelidium mucronatum]|nr:P-loop containing nucleoside triphosphate hydrolase protein [Obelidium mucronatum]